MRYIFLPCIFILSCLGSYAQENAAAKQPAIDVSAFSDDAHHWYDINEKGAMILPRPGHPRYKSTDITAVADNILLFQKENGGWPKNYDMQAILTPDQVDSVLKGKSLENTTFDNRTTYSEIEYLAKVYGYTKTTKYKEGALKGLDFIIQSQYTNGGWPQYYPLEENNYSRYITYNDDAMTGVMWLLKDVIDGKPQYSFIDDMHRLQLQSAFDNGLDCILKTQIVDAGQPTAWCQQYDELYMQPAWARKFEPPSICNGESPLIVLLLMEIKHPSAAVINAVQSAVAWFKASQIKGIRIDTFEAPEMVTPFRVSRTDKRVVEDPQAPVIWARYYEIKTHRPLFCNRDSKVVYSLAEVLRERRDGYGWYTYEPQKVLNRYPAWQKEWAPAKNVLE